MAAPPSAPSLEHGYSSYVNRLPLVAYLGMLVTLQKHSHRLGRPREPVEASMNHLLGGVHRPFLILWPVSLAVTLLLASSEKLSRLEPAPVASQETVIYTVFEHFPALVVLRSGALVGHADIPHDLARGRVTPEMVGVDAV